MKLLFCFLFMSCVTQKVKEQEINFDFSQYEIKSSQPEVHVNDSQRRSGK